MFETITKHVRENSVVRFLLSHLIILLAALLICAVGFRSAFVIVRNDVLDSTMFAMTQAVSSVDNGLTELRTLGMQTARSESIYRLENLRHTDDNYYQNIIRAINEYYQRMLYYSPNWVNNTFIYLNSMDRVIYNRAVYAPIIHSSYGHHLLNSEHNLLHFSLPIQFCLLLFSTTPRCGRRSAAMTTAHRFSASWVGRTSITASPAAA